jgi:hypothetical protein
MTQIYKMGHPLWVIEESRGGRGGGGAGGRLLTKLYIFIIPDNESLDVCQEKVNVVVFQLLH